MPTESIHLDLDGMAAEIELALRAAAAQLQSQGVRISIDRGSTPPDDALVICAEQNPTSFRKAWRVSPGVDEGLVRLSRGDRSVRIPWEAVPSAQSRRLPPAILARGGNDVRAMRMLERTAEELSRRRIVSRFALWGSPANADGARLFDEVHTDPSPDDLWRLLSSSSSVFDPSESAAAATPLPWMAEAVGVPAVVAAEHPFPGGIRVDERSPESFADALERAIDLDPPRQAATSGRSARRLLEAFGIDA